MTITSPAIFTPVSGIQEDVGSNLTGGIVFAWEPDGNHLVYGVPNQNGTNLFRYSLQDESTSSLLALPGEVTQVAVLSDHRIGYCVIHHTDSASSIDHLSDPAYRYDGSTFRFTDKRPWQDGKVTKDGKRPGLNLTPKSDCFVRNEMTREIQPVLNSVVQLPNPMVGQYAEGITSVSGVPLARKNYEGGRVVVAWTSPNGKHVLYAARGSTS